MKRNLGPGVGARCAVMALVAAGSLAACAAGPPSSAVLLTPSSSASATGAVSAGSSAAAGVAVPAGLVGPGCAAFVSGLPAGPASVAAMAAEPLVTALAVDPSLTSVVAAVSGTLNDRVDLVDTLDGAEFTVFAPVDSAFATIGPRTLARLKTDRAFLTAVLRYHLVPGRLSPAAVLGRHATLQGASLTVAGGPHGLTVNGAHVVCGGIRTARSVVYLIDGSLQPPG